MKAMRGQSSIEFLIVVSFLMVLFTMMYVILAGQAGLINQFSDALRVSGLAWSVASTLNYVAIAGEGTDYNLTIIADPNMENITVANFSIEALRLSARSAAPLITSDINTSTIGTGIVRIRNINGGIFVG